MVNPVIRYWGMGSVTEFNDGRISACYNGNSGSRLSVVSEMTVALLGKTLQELRDTMVVVDEAGSPDYSYWIEFKPA